MHIDEENLVIMLHGNYQHFRWFIYIYLIILRAGRFLVLYLYSFKTRIFNFSN